MKELEAVRRKRHEPGTKGHQIDAFVEGLASHLHMVPDEGWDQDFFMDFQENVNRVVRDYVRASRQWAASQQQTQSMPPPASSVSASLGSVSASLGSASASLGSASASLGSVPPADSARSVLSSLNLPLSSVSIYQK